LRYLSHLSWRDLAHDGEQITFHSDRESGDRSQIVPPGRSRSGPNGPLYQMPALRLGSGDEVLPANAWQMFSRIKCLLCGLVVET